MEFRKRKSPRLKTYDYSNTGAYFITFCTHKKRKILSVIDDDGNSKLTDIGKILNDIIINLPSKLGVTIDSYVIMPNHVHLIMYITDFNEKQINSKRGTIPKVVGYIKANLSKRIKELVNNEIVWQRSFHDHIIRDYEYYVKIKQYIYENPLKWKFDCFYD